MVAIWLLIIFLITGLFMFLALGITSEPKPQKDGINVPSHDELIRYRTLDEVLRKCREMTRNSEVDYFSYEDICKIVDELKEKKNQ